jgi:hypothetical protein
MPCLITGGLVKDCDFLLGGLKTLYLANISDIDTYTDTTADDGIIDAIIMNGVGVFHTFEFEDNTASFTNEMQVSAGQKYVLQTVNFSLANKEAEVIAQMKDLALSTLVAIAVDRTGKRYILGRNNGLSATVASLNSGAAEGDFAGLTVTLSGSQVEFAPILLSTFDISTIL